MSEDSGASFREALQEVSRKVDTLTALLHTHIEKMLNQQDGMKRLGEKTDALEARTRDIELAQAAIMPQALEVRTRNIELAQAAITPQAHASSRWIESLIWVIVGAAVTAAAAMVMK